GLDIELIVEVGAIERREPGLVPGLAEQQVRAAHLRLRSGRGRHDECQRQPCPDAAPGHGAGAAGSNARSMASSRAPSPGRYAVRTATIVPEVSISTVVGTESTW